MYLVYILQYVKPKRVLKIGLANWKLINLREVNVKLTIICKSRVQSHATIHKNGSTCYIVGLV